MTDSRTLGKEWNYYKKDLQKEARQKKKEAEREKFGQSQVRNKPSFGGPSKFLGKRPRKY